MVRTKTGQDKQTTHQTKLPRANHPSNNNFVPPNMILEVNNQQIKDNSGNLLK